MDVVYESKMTKNRKFMVFESELMQLFQQCHRSQGGHFYSRNVVDGKW